MKRIILLSFLSFILFLLSSCAVPLDETEGIIPKNIKNNYETEEWVHEHEYKNDPLLYVLSDLTECPYSYLEYHYTRCSFSMDGSCSLPPSFERHERAFVGYEKYGYLSNVTLYNGHVYHTANYTCTLCGSDTVWCDYVLCSNNDALCDGSCENGAEFEKEHKTNGGVT